MNESGKLRVSVATLNRVTLRDPVSMELLLVLERKATLLNQAEPEQVRIRVQPLGGAVRILDPTGLADQIGEFDYDSPRTAAERDFRILINLEQWETVQTTCLREIVRSDGHLLESDPGRELAEEIWDALQYPLQAEHLRITSLGLVSETRPQPTDNVHATGIPTVRIYRVYAVDILGDELTRRILENNRAISEAELCQQVLADYAAGGTGRANALLALPYQTVRAAYQHAAPEQLVQHVQVGGYDLERSVAALFEDLEIPGYTRHAA